MKILNKKILNSLTDRAKTDTRLRKNLNLHDDHLDACQRILNAVEPNSYIRPHRHFKDPKSEFFVVLKGKIVFVTFDSFGNILTSIKLGLMAGCDAFAIEVPPSIWHTVVSLKSGSILLEVKQGPYEQKTSKDYADWAPQENTKAGSNYLVDLKQRLQLF